MKKKLEKILVLSIWDEMWSLGEGCGVPDELHFIEKLTSRGIEIEYLIPEPRGKTAQYQRPGLRYHTYPNVFRSLDPLPGPLRRIVLPGLFMSRLMPVLRRLVREYDPDLILGYSYYSLGPLKKIGMKTGIPTAVKLFGVMYLRHHHLPWIQYRRYNHEQISALRHKVDHYIVLNDGTQGRDALVEKGIDPEKITFLPNGMDLRWAELEIDRVKTRRALHLPEGKRLAVTFSRLVRSKRVDLFLKAMAAVDSRLLDEAAVVIGGDGPDLESLKKLSRELGIFEKVYFTGAVKYNEIPLLLKSCDFFVGTNELTNMSMPPCEALLCGLPVVAFDIAGTSEVVRDGETGLLVSAGDLDGMTAKIETLLGDPGMVSKLGRQASDFAKNHFMSWDERTSKELEVFDQLVSER
ncbi:MAG: glycosyltransferase family 4 protein [Candidatus Krumholzibacteriota bacterium]|nr:glycosyltransferase family 4 protein [Candidatus Krumholzibacteriota bacterium]